MNLNQVQIFCTVAKHLSFSMAAEELFITQPAVSQQVKALERQLNVKLFERVGPHIDFTAHLDPPRNALSAQLLGNSANSTYIRRPILTYQTISS